MAVLLSQRKGKDPVPGHALSKRKRLKGRSRK